MIEREGRRREGFSKVFSFELTTQLLSSFDQWPYKASYKYMHCSVSPVEG